MRFGLFYEHQLPRPWLEGAHEQLLHDALDQIELADRVGFDYVWEVEHHFLEEYSHSSAPEVFLGAASQRTQRIRLGHGIVQIPPPFNHPARVAERAATLDLISGGRLELGTGEASSQMELGGFGIDRRQKRAMWEESLDAITRMLVEEPYAGADGEFVQMPPRNVMPKPKQRPHPPLWVACSRRDTILMAARKGLGALSFSFVEPEQAKEWVDEYYALIQSDECMPAGFAVNPNVAVVLPMMCHEDEATAIDRGIDGAHFFGYSLAFYYAFGAMRPGVTSLWDDFLANRERRGFARSIVTPDQAPLGVKLLQQDLGSLRGAIGTPDQIADLVERYERAGVDQIIFVSQSGKTRHEHICESLELFAAKVMPRFAGRADAVAAAKRERLAAACERALARRGPPRAAPDYEVQPLTEPRPANLIAAARSHRNGGASLGAAAQQAAESAFAAYVRGRSDEQLERTIGSSAGLRTLFKVMARQYVPERSGGFEGDVLYELETSRGTRHWTVHIDAERAVARQRRAAEPALTMKMPLPLFVRIGAGELNPVRAMLDGELDIAGDFALVGRLAEMFGRSV
jgi:alkanesulfonate monooxygenase SsuD/methylene tetrahydromethanopterin reductase-like flavin-dependent oxidoreductase (luciferase family)/putative sterol carrier protein